MSPNRALLPRSVPTSTIDLNSFEQLRAPRAASARFPKSLKIVVWNCRGIQHKKISINSLFEVSNADIIILNETFRKPRVPWPSDLPPCLAEATSESTSTTRTPNGVAVLANPRSIGHHGRIRSFSVIDTDNINGLKVVLKVNQFIIFAVYAPTSAGPGLLRDFATEAKNAASNGQPVILCGDFNATNPESSESMDYLIGNRGRILIENLGRQFFRVDTGTTPTRPSNRTDSISDDGSLIDHIFVANTNGLEGQCLSDFTHTSDHHPISARIRHHQPPADNSVKYWRLRLERLKQDEVKLAYHNAVQDEMDTLHSAIVSACPVLTRLSSISERQSGVDNMEKIFIGGIMNIAKRVIGRKAVPVVPFLGKLPQPSVDYQSTATSLAATYADLRRFAGLGSDNPRVGALLLRRDELKSRLSSIERSSQTKAFHSWRDELCNLPVPQRLKVLNRVMRRRSAAGACLSSTPIALENYRNHFEAQFQNEHGIPPFENTPVALDQSTELSVALMTFQTDTVKQMILRSPSGKAPGASGMPAELLHPVAQLISPTMALMFAVYMNLAVVPTSWKRALICPVPKKGDLSQISNHRPISLTEVTRKIFEMALLTRLHATNAITLSKEQGGFREGRSTIDQVFCLDKVTKFIRRQGRKVFIAFLDIKAAYDSVPRGELWRQCENQGLDHVTISCLRSLFDHNSAQLVVSQHRSRPIALPAGVLQGSVLSPLLYSIYLDPLVEKLRAHGPRISFPNDSTGINSLLYADDIALIASSPRDLRRLLTTAEEDSLERGYRFSPQKCIVVGMDHSVFKLYDAPLVHQSSFCYLGIEVNCRGVDEKKHAKARASKAIKVAERLKQAGARFKNFPVCVNIQLYAAFIRPGLEYGIILIFRNRSAMWLLQSAQKHILCDFLNVNPNARNDVIEAITNCPTLSTRCKILRTRRAEKLQVLWSQANCLEHALVFVLRAIDGDELPVDSDLLPLRSTALVRFDDYCIPVSESLNRRYGGHITIGILRWLLLLRLPDGIFRTLLLWILQRWRIFGPAKCCQYCDSFFTCQYHIASCSGLRHRIVSECPIEYPELEQLTHLPEAVVEHAIKIIMMQTAYPTRTLLTHVEHSIRDAIQLVFGPASTTTY